MSADPPAPRAAVVRDFLRTLEQRTRNVRPQTPLPAPTRLPEVEAGDDLTTRFTTAAEAAGCVVRRVRGGDWVDAVCDILDGLGARKVLVELSATEESVVGPVCNRSELLRTALAGRGVAATTERDDETLFTVDAAVTDVRGAVAETGTIVCESSDTCARGSSLIPPVHIAVVAASQIVPDLFDLFEILAAECDLPANVNLITGPSKTADIEGVLVTGMHGPGQVYVVLLEEPT